jgi:hypothetical protein
MPKPSGTSIKYNEELARIQINQGVINDEGNLVPWVIECLEGIKYNLI